MRDATSGAGAREDHGRDRGRPRPPDHRRRPRCAVRETRLDRAGRLPPHPGMHELRHSRPGQSRVDARRGALTAPDPAGDRGGHHLLRHRQRLLGRHERGDRGARAEGLRAPRGRRARHEGVHADAQGPQRRRALAQGDPARDRREPEAARHRLRGPLPDPPLRPGDARRGDDGGAPRRREGGQGALHRGEFDVRLAVLEAPVHGGGARLDALRGDAGPLQPALPRGGARDAAALRGPGRGRAAVEPAGARAASPVRGTRRRSGRARTSSARRSTRRGTARSSRRSGGSRRRARSPRHGSRSRGCSSGPASPRRSSA
ncbi:hypothetical protein GA0115252_12809 [Streptomyces sp. DfronAA-171]|nr:hypothetical protein GA0115252_12809 [Streptomyces sp. DfronAA-171]